MSQLNATKIEKYRNQFLREVEANVEEGKWVKMCMQCGVCSGSCPLGPYWEHPPQEIFMMIRAGKRDEVLQSSSMWFCTSCYNCIARCPRELPITHIMHGLAHYAQRLGLAPQNQTTPKFAQRFWDNLYKSGGRVNELKLGLSLYFMNGFVEGIKTALKMRKIGQGMYFSKRMNPFEIFGGHSCKDRQGLKAALNKAREIEEAKAAQFKG
jgi:quinone-modifying oxidoreductase subunit QmoC